ncbi:mannose-6-phosphate isomerase [Deinococcus irradiatisoli]|uniref:Mannose-6-phosphate isomerase n=1 Tax=Deinococcus irradiatisoli TaxID=2202254 RepID=A0A2Z3JFF4_9DEIO|nr:cupin domain-containing protein [Deinococcus irradiatisoli]AWN23705.1 mannose-6-phosphate isomerase [Deinococcus irradiatisoli]
MTTPSLQKVSLADKFAAIPDYWNPRVVGEVSGHQVKLAKFQGEFDWHHHEHEDELFLVVRGELVLGLRDPDERELRLSEGELIVVPRGVSHRPAAGTPETWVMMFEPGSTLNTGNLRNERTRTELERL